MLDYPGRYTGRFLGKSVLVGNKIEMSYLSEVYLGKDLQLQPTAVKISHPLRDGAAQESLARIEQVMRLSHPNLLVPRQAFLLDDGGEQRLVEVSQYLPEPRWDTLDNAQHQLSLRESLRAVRHATTGLAQMHSTGLVHHDARATNIFVDLWTAEAKLFDYNTTRAPYDLADGVPDARNVAPEFHTGGRIGYEFDVWLIGTAISDIATDFRQQGRAWKPDVPTALVDIISRATAQRPEDRYRNAGELLRALDSL